MRTQSEDSSVVRSYVPVVKLPLAWLTSILLSTAPQPITVAWHAHFVTISQKTHCPLSQSFEPASLAMFSKLCVSSSINIISLSIAVLAFVLGLAAFLRTEIRLNNQETEIAALKRLCIKRTDQLSSEFIGKIFLNSALSHFCNRLAANSDCLILSLIVVDRFASEFKVHISLLLKCYSYLF